jgi:hypothetical protein
MLLQKADDGVDDHDDADRDSVEKLAKRKRHSARTQQQPDDWTGELARQQDERTGRFLTLDFIGAKFG